MNIIGFINQKFAKLSNLEIIDSKEPELFRSQFPYSEVPKIFFDDQITLLSPAEEIWITDTTFRDGQQARPPYQPEQIVKLYEFLHRLGGSKGVIRQSEFFLYSERDRKAVEGCLAKGYEFPEITGWIRANAEDFKLVRSYGLKETGILTSVSDYHIFLKLKSSRAKTLDDYLAIVKNALAENIIPRCHFEDITRADIYGFCLPFAEKLLILSEEAKIPIKIRLCDTMGYGLTYPQAILPRSVPKLAHAFHKELGYPSHLLEWHGHNDFHKVLINGSTAWLYGISALNTSLLGYGERTGNPPLEGAVIEYIGLKGSNDGIDTTVITEIAEYFENEIKTNIPSNYPFIGKDFNTTRAGIHADGMLKNQEIYNIFDTDKILKRPFKVTVTDKSGMAGIARWINENIPAVKEKPTAAISKRHPGIKHIYNWVMEQYEQGRTTSISPDELIAQTKHYVPSLFESDFKQVVKAAEEIAIKIIDKISKSDAVLSMDSEKITPYLNQVVHKEHSIQLLAIINLEGIRVSQVYTQRGEKGLFRNLMTKNFKKHDWFLETLKTKKPYYSDLFFSKYTKILIFTAALPLFDKNGEMFAVLDVDFKFEELVKLINNIPEGIL